MEGGRLYDADGIAVIELRGDWHAMGRQYGALAESRMKDVLEYIDTRLAGDAASIASANDIASKLYANYPDHLKDFFEGVAETSSLTPERIRLCNAVEYVEGCFLCSAMAVWGDYSDGKLIFGRNYDAAGYSEIDRDVLVTVYHPEGGLSAATVGYAGEIYCVNGLNEKGIFIELNNGMPSAGYEIHWDLRPGTTELFDQLFKARSLEDMDRFFNETRCFASFIISVADDKEARSYEWCYDGVKRGDVMTPDGLMVSTNHYVNGEWPYDTPSDADSWNSICRRCNLLDRVLENRGRLDVSEVKAIMSASLDDGGPCHSLTRYQIVAVPEDLMLHIKLPCHRKWSAVGLADLM